MWLDYAFRFVKWTFRITSLAIVIFVPATFVFGADVPTQRHLDAMGSRPNGYPLLVGHGGGSVTCTPRGCDHSNDYEQQTFLFVPDDLLVGTLTVVNIYSDGRVTFDREPGALYFMLAMYGVCVTVLVLWWRSRHAT